MARSPIEQANFTISSAKMGNIKQFTKTDSVCNTYFFRLVSINRSLFVVILNLHLMQRWKFVIDLAPHCNKQWRAVAALSTNWLGSVNLDVGKPHWQDTGSESALIVAVAAFKAGDRYSGTCHTNAYSDPARWHHTAFLPCSGFRVRKPTAVMTCVYGVVVSYISIQIIEVHLDVSNCCLKKLQLFPADDQYVGPWTKE